MELDLSKYFSEWGEAAFIVGVVFSSSLVEYAMVGSFMDFLRHAWDEKLPYAAATVNVQAGLVGLMAFAGAFLTDAYLGRFRMVLLSTIIYIVGLGLFTISASPAPERGPEAASIFYIAMFLISIGQGGYKPSLKALGSDQIEPQDSNEDPKVRKARSQAWWGTGTFFGTVVGLIVATFLNDADDWMTAGLVSTAVMIAALVVFLCRTPFYAIAKPCGSLLQRVARVLIAAAINRNADYPADGVQLYEKSQPSDGEKLLPHTDNRPRCLDKAAIRLSDAAEENDWRQCTVTQVEETKILLGVFPIWTTCLMYGLVKAMGSTFFFEQAIGMDRKMGKITVPLTSLLAFSSSSRIVVAQFLVPLVERSTKLEHGIPPMMKIGTGMFFSIICCSCASVVENRRLKMVKKLGTVAKKVPMSVFWLLPQFFMLGAMDGLMSDGLKEFFEENNHIPDSMKSFGPSFLESVIGMGSILSAMLVVVSTEVRKGGKTCWIGANVSDSHLDNFYRTFCVLSYVNLCVYMCISTMYCVKKEREVREELEIETVL